MGSRQIVLVSAAGFSILNTGIFWREAKTKGFFHSVLRVTFATAATYDIFLPLRAAPLVSPEQPTTRHW
jgi:hypothetical protein